MAPYSFAIAHLLRRKTQEICALLKEKVQWFWIFYDVNMTVNFLAFRVVKLTKFGRLVVNILL